MKDFRDKRFVIYNGYVYANGTTYEMIKGIGKYEGMPFVPIYIVEAKTENGYLVAMHWSIDILPTLEDIKFIHNKACTEVKGIKGTKK